MQSVLEINENKFKSLCEYIDVKLNEHQHLIQAFEQSTAYHEIVSYYKQLNSDINLLEKSVVKNKTDLKITISEKFKNSLPEELVIGASIFNNKLLKNIDDKLEILKNKKNCINKIYQNKLNEWRQSIISISGDSIENYKEALFGQCNNLKKEIIKGASELSNEIEKT